jgi:hypothetical protein
VGIGDDVAGVLHGISGLLLIAVASQMLVYLDVRLILSISRPWREDGVPF